MKYQISQPENETIIRGRKLKTPLNTKEFVDATLVDHTADCKAGNHKFVEWEPTCVWCGKFKQ